MSPWMVLLLCAAVVTAVPVDQPGPTNNAGLVVEGTMTARYNPDTENQYHLFTRLNPQLSQVIVENQDALLQASNFDPSKRTIVLIHGSWTSILSPFYSVMVPAILGVADVNIIAVDWSAGADWGLNSIDSGKSVARVLKWVLSVTGANNLENIHIIGHHSGAHQAGIVGKQFSGQIGYITGLDPEFTWWFPDTLQASDAIYTEVIHTNAGELGFEQPLGQVDFYPNGGVEQPGCINNNHCSNHRSFYFMAESLSTGGFVGWQCDSHHQALAQQCSGQTRLEMGGLTPKIGYKGVFSLKTNAAPPFAQDIEDLKEK